MEFIKSNCILGTILLILSLFKNSSAHLENCPYTSVSHAQLISPFPAKALCSEHHLLPDSLQPVFSFLVAVGLQG